MYSCHSLQITSDDDHVTTSYVIFSKSNNGDYTWIRNVSLEVNVFNITGLHPNRGYAFAVQPLGDVINGSKADCPEDSCRTEQAGTCVHTNCYTARVVSDLEF